jgi:uncharacterized membrane protein HdeD (DUF308 family)
MKKPAFWIPLLRGLFAISLGVALLFQPDKSRPMLVNFMGFYWLMSGILSIRWGVHGQRASRLSLLAGAVGVMAGLAALSRNVSLGLLSELAIIYLLGVVILLTGALHMAGGFRTGEDRARQWSWGSFVLGFFEIVLGAMLLIEPFERGPVIYYAASIWAFLGGAMLIGDALRVRAQAMRAEQGVDGDKEERPE